MVYVTHDQVEAMTLGDRVAVLDRGRLQQAAPPRELYERPANVFVAGFIGNPPMNLFATRVSANGRGLAVGSQTLSIGDAAHASLESARTAGVRPEAVHVKAGAATDGAVRAVVEHVEYLGHEALAHVSIDGGIRLVARVDGMPALRRGQTVSVGIDPDAVHLFAEDGRALGGLGPAQT